MQRFVAFLRGINVGGKAIVKMADLKAAFEELAYDHVETLLNSGNVCFSTNTAGNDAIRRHLETHLEKVFSRKLNIILRDANAISRLIATDPFANIDVTPATRLYVTFLSEKPTSLTAPPSTDPNFRIISVTEKEVCSALTVTEAVNSTDLMKVIEKTYGKNVTTRNWNTVLRVHSVLQRHTSTP